MRNFYESTFGWKTEQVGPEMGDYVLVETTETDKSRRPKTPGSINGGFYPKKEDWPWASPWKFRATGSTSGSSIPRAIASA
jgi:predicted enzyme related to lactoylglutathione lyase